jgi:hypothetical protein
MPERDLGYGLRVLLALLGITGIAAGGAVGAVQLRTASNAWPQGFAIVIALFCVVVIWGGLILLRGAVRGRITVRPTRRPRAGITRV